MKVIYIQKKPEKMVIPIKAGESLTCVLIGFLSGKKEITFELKGKGAQVKILGVFVLKDSKVELKTIQKHDAKETKSDLEIKSIVFDDSSFDYQGLINISKKGQQSNAYQKNDNLIIGDGQVKTIPELEILADDVICSHGSTTSQLDKQDIFYLMSKGLSKKRATKLLIEGFLAGVVNKIPNNEKIIKEIELCLSK